MAVAGCAAFLLTRLAGDWGIPFPFAPLLAAGAAALVGLLVAIPPVRIRGVTLAVVTLSFASALDQLVFNNNDPVGLSSPASSAGSPSPFVTRSVPPTPTDHPGHPRVPLGLFLPHLSIPPPAATAQNQ